MTPPPRNPKVGDTYTAYNFTWKWVPAQEVERGHWLADDGSRVKVFPPSGGINELRVSVPGGPLPEMEDSMLHIGPDDWNSALIYASDERKARAN